VQRPIGAQALELERRPFEALKLEAEQRLLAARAPGLVTEWQPLGVQAQGPAGAWQQLAVRAPVPGPAAVWRPLGVRGLEQEAELRPLGAPARLARTQFQRLPRRWSPGLTPDRRRATTARAFARGRA
jgi:hypothetical protein